MYTNSYNIIKKKTKTVKTWLFRVDVKREVDACDVKNKLYFLGSSNFLLSIVIHYSALIFVIFNNVQ